MKKQLDLKTTYASQQGERSFDWNKALLKKNWPKTVEDQAHLIKLASDWVTCACGNQCAIIPRSGSGYPTDFELKVKGCLFRVAIKAGNYILARKVLVSIEKRSAILIKEIIHNS